MRGWGQAGDDTGDVRLQATMHDLLCVVHIYIDRYVYIRECMLIYAKSPKVTITFIRRSKIVV